MGGERERGIGAEGLCGWSWLAGRSSEREKGWE
jgi:hypothetical protein